MIKKCLFPAAGYGTRFLPATKATPKEMLPVLTKPLIQYGIEEALEAGITTMAIVTGRGKRAIEDHFDIGYKPEQRIKGTPKGPLPEEIRSGITKYTSVYTKQLEIKELGHATLTSKTFRVSEAFAITLDEDLCYHGGGSEPLFKQTVKVFEKYQRFIVTIEEVPIGQPRKYGIIPGGLVDDTVHVKDMVEKPFSQGGAQQTGYRRPPHPCPRHLRHPAPYRTRQRWGDAGCRRAA